MSNGSRTATVKLPDSLIKEIADQLKIKDVTRIPRNLVVNAVDLKDVAASATRGASMPGGVSLIHVIA